MPPDPDVNPPLSTARLTLEPQTAAHADTMFQVQADPRTHAFISSEPPTDPEVMKQRYMRMESRYSPDRRELWFNWVVFRLDEAIGTVQATVNLTEASADVAYVFHPAAWGQGYAGEALSVLLEFLHKDLMVHRFKANIDTRNLASQRLVERLGFVRIREIKGADEFKGVVSDEFVYERQTEDQEPAGATEQTPDDLSSS